MKRFLGFLILVAVISCNDNSDSYDPSIVPPPSGIAAPAQISYNIIAQHPHDTSAYTQGLELYKGKMYEATGDFENSSLRITDYTTGKVEQIHKMGKPMNAGNIFGEGITIFKNKIYQLTWESNIVYVYNINDISKPVKTFKWPYQGWGITNNGTDLIVSDGTSNLYIVNAEDFKVKSTIAVVSNKGPIDNLNELEYVNGFVYANVYETSTIVKIDLESGHVVGVMNFNNLLQQNEYVPGRTDYFNGIAYDSTSNTMFVTGKRWPKLFEVKMN